MIILRPSRGWRQIQLIMLAAIVILCYVGLGESWSSTSPKTAGQVLTSYKTPKDSPNDFRSRPDPPGQIWNSYKSPEDSPYDFRSIQPVRPERYKPEWITPLPKGKPVRLPKIQHEFPTESKLAKTERERRASAVKDAFVHAYHGYQEYAWAKDELAPVTGTYKTPFCGWSATLVDSLDTMYIMGMHDEFAKAVEEVDKIDFTGTEGCMINLFEVTIRHLGGLIAAYDISGAKHPKLLKKAVELGEILYTAFDTPNRMPSPHYIWSATNAEANSHQPSGSVVLAVLGTIQLEFTRLSQLTGNDKYYSAVQGVMDELEKWQNETALPGMWPAMVDSTLTNQPSHLGSARPGSVEEFTLGATADSTYEYLPKQYILLGGLLNQGRQLYETFVEVARKHLFYRPMTRNEEDVLIAGKLMKAMGGMEGQLVTESQHLTCFIGGLLALAGRVFQREEDVKDGAKLAAGCVWGYKSTSTGIMPETFTAVACSNTTSCPWNEKKWLEAVILGGSEHDAKIKINQDRLPPGFAHIQDRRYLLRPEAIESVFILYRITGDNYWYEAGWDMFKAIETHTRLPIAHSAIDDVTSLSPSKTNEMESFWLAETLKYFYLLFSEPSVISLDEYVLNTEAHPLKRRSEFSAM